MERLLKAAPTSNLGILQLLLKTLPWTLVCVPDHPALSMVDSSHTRLASILCPALSKPLSILGDSTL